MDYPKSVPSVGLVGGKFVDEDPIAGTPGSLIPAQWGNGVTQEVLNVLNAAGILPDEFDNAQLLLAISNLSVISQAQYVLSSGTANAIAANYSPAVTALTDGMVLKFKALSVNTGAATFNPNALGAKPIVGGAHNALQGGEITANGDVWLQYNASLGGGSWVLIASTGGGVQFAAGAYGGTALQFDNSKKFATTEFVRQAGFQFSQTTQYTSGPRALIASQAGSFIDLAGSYTGDITLPALSSVPDGANFYIWSGASASLNVIRSGADQIFVNGTVVNSIAMNNGDTLVIGKSSPAGAWVAMWGLHNSHILPSTLVLRLNQSQFPVGALGRQTLPA